MSAPEARRIRRVCIDPQALMLLLREGKVFCISAGIPEGAGFIGTAHDQQRNCVVLYVEHPSFELAPFGKPIPEHIVSFDELRIMKGNP